MLVVLIFRQVIEYLRNRKYFNIVIRWIDTKIESRAKKLKAASILGLIVFVGNVIAGAIMLGVFLHISEGSTEMIIASLLLVLVVTIVYMSNKRK